MLALPGLRQAVVARIVRDEVSSIMGASAEPQRSVSLAGKGSMDSGTRLPDPGGLSRPWRDVELSPQLISKDNRGLPAQGTPVTIRARATRWRCRNEACDRQIFAERLPHLAARFARWTTRPAAIVRLLGYSVGGRPSERLMSRLGTPVNDTTILRSIKEAAQAGAKHASVRVVGIDEWAWRKGLNYGTIMVDLEQREVIGLLADRSASTSAGWFGTHPDLEIVSRDRADLYADAARQGAPQARHVGRSRS